MEKLPKEITVRTPGNNFLTLEVNTSGYVAAKTGDLKSFGYETLTEGEVEAQLLKILNGCGSEDLSIIGMFLKDDIVIG